MCVCMRERERGRERERRRKGRGGQSIVITNMAVGIQSNINILSFLY